MHENSAAGALETTARADLHALVPPPRDAEGIDQDDTDDASLYIAELIAAAPPLPATVARLLRDS